jgi:MFS family permease
MARRLIPSAGEGGVFASLRHSDYRGLWTASTLSAVANWTVLTGRGWVAFDLHQHSSTVGLVVFASMLPYVIVTPVAGVLAGLPTNVHRGWLLFGTGILSGATIILLSFAGSWPTALVSAALVGGSQAMFMALTNTILQIQTPDYVRGRVLSIYLMLGGGVMAFANLASGGLADAYGVTPVLSWPALIFMLVVVASAAGTALRGVYARRTAPAAAH